MESLKDISIRMNYPTDKGTYHDYLPVYQQEFDKIDSVKILEIGVYTGGSIRLWREYFKNAEIHGIDNNSYDNSDIPAIMHWGKFEDVSERFDDNYFDYIINDSMHDHAAQIDAFKIYFSKLKYGGKFFMEDIINNDELNIILKFLDGYSVRVWDMNDTSSSKDSIILVVEKK
jgi:hypothetical protein